MVELELLKPDWSCTRVASSGLNSLNGYSWVNSTAGSSITNCGCIKTRLSISSRWSLTLPLSTNARACRQRAALAVSSALLLAVLMLEIHMTIFIIRYLAVSDKVHTRTASRPPPMSEASDMPPGTFIASSEENIGQQDVSTKRGKKKEARRIGGIRIGVVLRPMGFGLCCLVGLG